MYEVDRFSVGGNGFVAFCPIDHLEDHVESMESDGWVEVRREDIAGVEMAVMRKSYDEVALAGIQAW